MIHAPLATLEESLDHIRRSPADDGTIELIVRRPVENEREVLEEAELNPEEGLVGDRWRSPKPETQLTLMNARAAEAVAGPQARWALAGDQLYVDLDLSSGNLPPGTRVEIGEALVEIVAEPHTGCGKFARRFGVDALKFVNSTAGRELHLRGIYARILRGGTVRQGDSLKLLRDTAA